MPEQYLNPDRLAQVPPAELLSAAARGRLGIDHRFLRAILDRRAEALPVLVDFAASDRANSVVDLTPEIIAIFRQWKAQESLPFLIGYVGEDPTDVPDEALEGIVEQGQAALEPLLSLYGRLDEEESGEVAFMLAHLRVKDDRILQILLDRLEYDMADTVLLLGIYADKRARGSLEAAMLDLTEEDAELKREVEDVLANLDRSEQDPPQNAEFTFDIWGCYPEEADIPVEALDADDRLNVLKTAERPATRAAAAATFFNAELTSGQQEALLQAAQHDDSVEVRARAWESLMHSTENTQVVEAMLTALRNPSVPEEERAGLVVGLAPETDRNEVRDAIVSLYEAGRFRAKALEAMWRSTYPGFRDYFVPHLKDQDLETRRSAIWGVGYYGIKTEFEVLRGLFKDEELRSDALFAYALALPGETSRGRMEGMLRQIEEDASGLTELEEDLVKAALDERLMLAGKEPVFAQQQD